MESTVHVAESQTTPVWTDEKHVHFLNSMEASFVTTMLHRYGRYGLNHHLRLDRHIPDTSDSTLDSIPRRRTKKHAPSDSMGPIRVRMGSRRTRRRSYQLHNSSSEQVCLLPLDRDRTVMDKSKSLYHDPQLSHK